MKSCAVWTEAAIRNLILNYIEWAATSINEPHSFLVQGSCESSLCAGHVEHKAQMTLKQIATRLWRGLKRRNRTSCGGDNSCVAGHQLDERQRIMELNDVATVVSLSQRKLMMGCQLLCQRKMIMGCQLL